MKIYFNKLNGVFILIFCFGLIKLSLSQEYWQQEVDYVIDVTLNDRLHELNGNVTITYKNNSPSTLDRIYFHLWPNAYRNEYSALAKQLYRNGDEVLFVCPDSSKGWIDSLFFTHENKLLKWEYDTDNKDICLVYLPKIIRTGEEIVINTPFKVKIPSGEISRLGHLGQSYQITQWYPKPAVYDRKGWHPMPYLNQGEFYSEYGSFDVSITLPKNYVVGATGDLQTKSEINFLDELSQKTQNEINEKGSNHSWKKGMNEEVVSEKEFKTIRYKQSNVHDFAWFADKRYKVLKGEIELPHSKRKVTTWAMYTPRNEYLWKDALEYIQDGTYYYSLWNGDYPYNHVTAVDGTISAGGGMEYPNVTVIGNTSSKTDLEIVIVHEVGHNWFYGILGSNERVHGWMDEGLNTLNEMRYMRTKYPKNKVFSDMLLDGRLHFDNLSHHDMGDLSTQVISVLGKDQPIETHSNDFTSANYGVVMYQKTGLVFLYLKDYLGDELFDEVMRTYFNKWKFKHPYPEDLKFIAEKVSGKNLDWLFEDLIKTTKLIDYKICHVRKDTSGQNTRIKVKRKGQVNGPIELNVVLLDSTIKDIWLDPERNDTIIPISKDSIAQIIIDRNKDIPDLFRQNNSWTNKFLGKQEPIKLEFLFGDNELENSNLFWLPIINSNSYDLINVGLGIHNVGLPLNRFQYVLMPSLSLKRIRPTGSFGLSYKTFHSGLINNLNFGLFGSLFGCDETNISEFWHISPYLEINFRRNENSTISSNKLNIRSIFRKDMYDFKEFNQKGVQVKYNLGLSKTDVKLDFDNQFEYVNRYRESDMIIYDKPDINLYRFQSRLNFQYRYMKHFQSRWLSIVLTTGANFNSDQVNDYNYMYNGADGSQDFFLENTFYGRFEQQGFWSNQRLDNMGGFHTGAQQNVKINQLSTLNFRIELPYVPRFLNLFSNLGFGDNTFASNSGLGIKLGNVFSLDLPIIRFGNAFNQVDFGNYSKEIRFTFRFKFSESLVNISSLIK